MYLEPPPVDTKPDCIILATEEQMVDMRKRNKEGLRGYNKKVK